MKQKQKEILLFFIISHFSYFHLIWMFCSKKSIKKINAVHDQFLRFIRNDYESLYPSLLEEAQQITLHQRWINSLTIEVDKYLNGHSPDIINDIFKFRENMYYLRNFHIFQTENAVFKNHIKTWKCEDCPCRSCQIHIHMSGISLISISN